MNKSTSPIRIYFNIDFFIRIHYLISTTVNEDTLDNIRKFCCFESWIENFVFFRQWDEVVHKRQEIFQTLAIWDVGSTFLLLQTFTKCPVFEQNFQIIFSEMQTTGLSWVYYEDALISLTFSSDSACDN